MQLLNKNSDYAIRALVHVARAGEEYVASSDIAEKNGIPLSYIRRIIQKLVRAGYLSSREGAGGGVKLVMPPERISVGDVIRLLQNDIKIAACMFRKKICPERDKCVLRKRILGIEKKLAQEFDDITVATLVADMEGEDR
jgi:Rrf2 family protein